MYKRILSIQDISCVGQCSLTVALPILSASGIETAILPGAILSNHTGGFKGWTFTDLTEDMPAILERWEKENITFEAVYTGYLGSSKQIEYVQNIAKSRLAEGGKLIADPAMADNGKLYAGFDAAFVEEMKKLCFSADIILPNITEAALLTDSEYKETYGKTYTDELTDKLLKSGAKTIVFTGISYKPETTGVLVVENGKQSYYEHRRITGGFHGTGDVYASAFVGALENGFTALEAARIAADFTLECIENTLNDKSHWYGVKFETAIPSLIKALDLL